MGRAGFYCCTRNSNRMTASAADQIIDGSNLAVSCKNITYIQHFQKHSWQPVFSHQNRYYKHIKCQSCPPIPTYSKNNKIFKQYNQLSYLLDGFLVYWNWLGGIYTTLLPKIMPLFPNLWSTLHYWHFPISVPVSDDIIDRGCQLTAKKYKKIIITEWSLPFLLTCSS